MSVTFKNAPLLELMVELRWSPSSMALPNQLLPAQGGGPLVQVSMLDESKSEEFYLKLAGELYGEGYQRSERVVPQGMPLVGSQVAVRFRRDGHSEVFQVGPGVFTANAVQPYQSWKQFAPIVGKGLGALLKARPDAEASEGFNLVLLRYIDAFHGELLNGMAPLAFIRDVLGFNFGEPQTVSELMGDSGSRSVHYAKNGTLKGGQIFSLTVGDGVLAGEPAVMLDVTISTPGPIAATVEEVMAVLDGARDIAHKVFVEMTQPIASLMQPE